MASKLYTQYVQPEQDLLAFSAAELQEAVNDFETARQRLRALEEQHRSSMQ